MRVKVIAHVLLVAEFEVEQAHDAYVQAKLDAFRDAALPSIEHGISLYRPTGKELKEFETAGLLAPGVSPGVMYETRRKGGDQTATRH